MRFEFEAGLGGFMLQEQRQVLSQRQIESINILAMDAQGLYEFVMREQEENPIITPVSCEPFRAADIGGDALDDFLANIPCDSAETAADILLPQIDMREFGGAEEAAFRLIAESLNESGWLTETPEELSDFSGIPICVLQKCIGVMKNLKPAGVCASSLSECLELQLRARGICGGPVVDIVRNHLDDVAAGSVNRLARKIACDSRHVRECIAVIRSLNPRPLNGLVGEGARGAVPDIILSRSGDLWVVELNDGGFRSFGIDEHYLRLVMKTDDLELKSYFREKLRRVRFLNDAFKRRRDTLTDIGELVAREQSDFLLRGGSPAPLYIGAAAYELGLHPSTVSRAVKGKYVQYPGGFRELRALFVRGTEGGARGGSRKIGEAGVSRDGVKQMNRGILKARQKGEGSLLSDDKIAAMLSEYGIKISRRTVAKYRGELGIAGMHDRV